MSEELRGILRLLGDLERRVAHLETLEATGDISGDLSVGGGVEVAGAIAASVSLGCRLRRSTTQSIPSGDWTTIRYNTKVDDTDGCWDSGDPEKIYARTEGPYLVTASVVFDGSSGGGERWLGVRLNGAKWLASANCYPGQGNGSLSVAVVTPGLDPSNGDYVSVRVYQTSGDYLDVLGGWDVNQHHNSVSFYRLP